MGQRQVVSGQHVTLEHGARSPTQSLTLTITGQGCKTWDPQRVGNWTFPPFQASLPHSVTPPQHSGNSPSHRGMGSSSPL